MIELQLNEVGHPYENIELSLKPSPEVDVVNNRNKFDVDSTGISASVTNETRSASISRRSAYPTSNGRNRLSSVVLGEDATGNGLRARITETQNVHFYGMRKLVAVVGVALKHYGS